MKKLVNINIKFVRNILFIVIILIAGSVPADDVTNGDEHDEEHAELSLTDWIGHATLSIFGLILGIIILITGGMIKGRFKKPKKGNLLRKHKFITVFFTIIVILSFIYGLWITSGHEDAVLLSSIHGIIGLMLVVFSLLSLILSPCISKMKIGGRIHSILGYLIVIFLIIQLYLGFQNVI